MEWQVGFSQTENEYPELFYPATVPGAVQLDMKAALGYPDYNIGTNVLEYRWMEDRYWWYRTVIQVDDREDCTPVLVFLGIEYAFVIRINGERKCEQEGMFTPVELDMSEYAGKTASIEVMIYPSPRRAGVEENTAAQASASCKPPFSYGWDWCPRLVSLGIYRDVVLEYRPYSHIAEWDVDYRLNETIDRADLKISYYLAQVKKGAKLSFVLTDQHGAVVLKREETVTSAAGELLCTLDNPQLWWPNGHGDPTRYRAQLTYALPGESTSCVERWIGFRCVQLSMNAKAWDPMPFPTTRANPPITIQINGKRIFAKGSNLVPPDIFPSRCTPAVCEELVRTAKELNMNILRLWGGGYILPNEFYELCDRYGIMVWQEFPLACNNYPDDAQYLRILDQESRSIIRQLRRHPALVMWCGGNELFCYWSGMTDQSLALRLLDHNCLELDPLTPFIASSPLHGMVHGFYCPIDPESGTEAISMMCNAHATAYTEFGCGAPSPWEYLTTFMPPEELRELTQSGSWKLHHAVEAWDEKDTWFSPKLIEYFVGKSEDLQTAVVQGNAIQTLIYRHLFEEARMQWPICSMALNWCYNEPWPTAAGNSLMNYPAVRKPCCEAVKAALADQAVAVRIPRLAWSVGEQFTATVWLLNDSDRTISAGRIQVKLMRENAQSERLLLWEHDEIAPRTNCEGKSISWVIPNDAKGKFTLCVESVEHPEWNTTYTILIRPEA